MKYSPCFLLLIKYKIMCESTPASLPPATVFVAIKVSIKKVAISAVENHVKLKKFPQF